MDNRLTALETKWDAIIPTLATKADLAQLRADLHEMAASYKTWALATLIALLTFQAGLFTFFSRPAHAQALAQAHAGPPAMKTAGEAPTNPLPALAAPLTAPL